MKLITTTITIHVTEKNQIMVGMNGEVNLENVLLGMAILQQKILTGGVNKMKAPPKVDARNVNEELDRR